jgi:hypothetical protein
MVPAGVGIWFLRKIAKVRGGGEGVRRVFSNNDHHIDNHIDQNLHL